MKDTNDLEQTVKNAKITAEKDGYDQYILRDCKGNHSYIRKFHTLKEECRLCAMFRQQVIGIVKTIYNNGTRTTKYIKL